MGALSNCSKLEAIYAENVTKVQNFGFYNSPKLGEAYFPKIQYVGAKAGFLYLYNGVVDCIFPDLVTDLGGYSAAIMDAVTMELPECNLLIYGPVGCPDLEELRLPKVKEVFGIGDCPKLKHVEIPSAVSIGNGENSAFYNLPSLEEIELPDSLETIGGEFDLINDFGEVMAHRDGAGAFYNCGLKEITIPPSVSGTVVGFGYCSQLESLTLPEGVTRWKGAWFEPGKLHETVYSGIRQVNFPSTFKVLGERTLWRAIFMKELTLLSSLQAMEEGCLEGCDDLLSINMNCPSSAISSAPETWGLDEMADGPTIRRYGERQAHCDKEIKVKWTDKEDTVYHGKYLTESNRRIPLTAFEFKQKEYTFSLSQGTMDDNAAYWFNCAPKNSTDYQKNRGMNYFLLSVDDPSVAEIQYEVQTADNDPDIWLGIKQTIVFKKAGSVTLTATTTCLYPEPITTSCKLNIVEGEAPAYVPLTGIGLNIMATTLYLNDSSRNTVLLEVNKLIPENATVNKADAIWSSSDPGIATVSSSGFVTAVRPGTVKITVSLDGKTAECTTDVLGSSGGGSSSGSKGTAGIGGGPGKAGTASLPDYVVKGNWTQDETGSWKFTGNDGILYRSKWAAVENPYANTAAGKEPFDWFYFDANGNMMTGWYQAEDGNLYYMNPNSDGTRGKMVTGWVWIPDQNGVKKYYYFNPNSDGTRGKLIKNAAIDGKTVNGNGEWTVDGTVQTQ